MSDDLDFPEEAYKPSIDLSSVEEIVKNIIEEQHDIDVTVETAYWGGKLGRPNNKPDIVIETDVEQSGFQDALDQIKNEFNYEQTGEQYETNDMYMSDDPAYALKLEPKSKN